MWARLARFEGDPADIDERLSRLRARLAAGAMEADLGNAKFMMLVDRESGGMIGVTLFENEQALREGDAKMNTGPGHSGSRSSVEFYEVPLHTL